jgi:hypothetical protein
MSHEGSCHCGSIQISLKDDPVDASECNCSICRRTGALWTYAAPAEVSVLGEGIAYVHGDKSLKLFHCTTCGVITHWNAIDPHYTRMGINLRLFDPKLWETLPRKLVDGASW